jgi:putative transposase
MPIIRRIRNADHALAPICGSVTSVRDIQGHLRDLYGIDASPQLISTVTDAVLEEVGRWKSRPLDPLYALVFFDALRVKMRDERTVRKMIYTTNSMESLNSQLRCSVRIRGDFPSDEAATKLIWLQLREITKNRKMPAREWSACKSAIRFGVRRSVRGQSLTHRLRTHKIHDGLN